MSNPSEKKPDNPEQSKRFKDAARELGVDESEEAFEHVLEIFKSKPTIPEKSVKNQ